MNNNFLVYKINLLYEQNKQKDELDILIDNLKSGKYANNINHNPKPKRNGIIKGSTTLEDNRKDIKDFQLDDKKIEYPKTKNLEIETKEIKDNIIGRKETKEINNINHNDSKSLDSKETKELIDYIKEHPGMIGSIAATGISAYAVYRYLRNKKKNKR